MGSAPASADNILELKAQESIVRGQVGWSQQSSENSRDLTICGAYDPADFTDVQSLPGILEPTGFFDPAGLSDGVSPSELKRYREAELTHGRVAMLASLGFLVGESGATPLFGGKIDGIAINQFWKVPEGFWPVILLFIAVPEVFRALRGWMDPSVPENYFQLRPGYIPGDLDFDPAGLKPEDPEEFKEMQTKELQHCRLAMLAAAGMIVQELQTGATLFYVSPLAPASADNILEVKAQESTLRGEVGWSQQSSENSHPLTLCHAGPSAAADFTDVQSLPGILEPTGFFDPAGLSEVVSPSELKRYREAELTHGRVAMLASLGFLVGESGATPLFGGKIDGIAINQFWQVPEGFWPVILLFIAVPETFRALRGWMEPTVPENYFQLR